MPESAPVAFLSYVHRDDEHDRGAITRLRDELQGEVRMQLGEDFHIFLDREDIEWGQRWRERVDESLDAVTLLIPILTPAFFRRKECRREVERFLQREQELGRSDLILPVYYVSAPVMDDEATRETDQLAGELARRQFADWRELRFEPPTSPAVRKTLSQLASRMRDSFWRTSVPVVHGTRTRADSGDTPRPGPKSPVAEAGKAETTARIDPPTRTVDPYGRADHVTIGEAIAAAAPGDRILVGAGLYREALFIDKPLEVLGQGSREDVVVSASGGNTILFKASIGRVSNLTLRQAGSEYGYGVDIAQGRLELEECDISSESLACVAVHGGADPRVRRNRIHHGRAGGIFVYEQGLGTFEDNEIFANQFAGIEVKEAANPTARRNRIHDGKSTGIFVNEQGLGTFEDNDVFANALSGLTVSTGANPTVRRNRIHDHHAAGVYVYEQGLGTFEDNEIFANRQAGVEVREGGNPTVRRNRINGNGYEAVWVRDSGRGTFEDNDLRGNERGAWDIAADCAPNVTRARNEE